MFCCISPLAFFYILPCSAAFRLSRSSIFSSVFVILFFVLSSSFPFISRFILHVSIFLPVYTLFPRISTTFPHCYHVSPGGPEFEEYDVEFVSSLKSEASSIQMYRSFNSKQDTNSQSQTEIESQSGIESQAGFVNQIANESRSGIDSPTTKIENQHRNENSVDTAPFVPAKQPTSQVITPLDLPAADATVENSAHLPVAAATAEDSESSLLLGVAVQGPDCYFTLIMVVRVIRILRAIRILREIMFLNDAHAY
jgi:hypothetical protein